MILPLEVISGFPDKDWSDLAQDWPLVGKDPAALPRSWWLFTRDPDGVRLKGMEDTLMFFRDILLKDHYQVCTYVYQCCGAR